MHASWAQCLFHNTVLFLNYSEATAALLKCRWQDSTGSTYLQNWPFVSGFFHWLEGFANDISSIGDWVKFFGEHLQVIFVDIGPGFAGLLQTNKKNHMHHKKYKYIYMFYTMNRNRYQNGVYCNKISW